MPPKRKAAPLKGAASKKAKKEVDEKADIRGKFEALKSAGSEKVHKPDAQCGIPKCVVYEDFDCMLNQTNIGKNNNKFYIIQVLQAGKKYYAWNRWGRVGEVGANALKGPFNKPDQAIADFEKKFKDKTKNKWADRESFEPVKGKYTLIEVEGDADDVAEEVARISEKEPVERAPTDSVDCLPCTLDKQTQRFIQMIFDNEMFSKAMEDFNIDVRKMPLGKLSKSQIAKGFECLEEIEKHLKSGKKSAEKLNELSSRFYTLIPHDFGRTRPPAITDLDTVRIKLDMLIVLGDIEVAQTMKKDKKEKKSKSAKKPHPDDINYESLNATLEKLEKGNKEYKVIENYLTATKEHASWGSDCKIMGIWKVDRSGEDARFESHNSIKNRKLLWHGTNVAVVAAILAQGLRIMPHSGGALGKGIYMASEHSKSAGYVGRTHSNVGVMFLAEAALGKEKDATHCDGAIVKAPAGFDCVVGRGRTEPDPKKDGQLNIDGRKVVVPQGKPKSTSFDKKSVFWQSEYLIYKESQARLRYVLQLQW